MKNFLFVYLFFLIASISLFAQDHTLKKDSLFVYTVLDKNITAFLDTFIIETRRIKYPSKDYFIYVNFWGNDNLTISLDCRKQKEDRDSIILYQNPYFQQAFILHQDILFQANFESNDITNYHKLTEIFEKVDERHCIYFKNPPLDFYDLSRKGEIDYEDQLISWLIDYYLGKWQEIFKIYFYLDETRTDFSSKI